MFNVSKWLGKYNDRRLNGADDDDDDDDGDNDKAVDATSPLLAAVVVAEDDTSSSIRRKSRPHRASATASSASKSSYDYGNNDQTQSSSSSFSRFLRKLRRRTPYYIPILSWIRTYDYWMIYIDIIAGLSVSALLIPQTIAYSLLAGLPPVYGLYGALVPPIIYFIFGTSRQLSVGPEALIALLLSSALHSSSTPTDDVVIIAILAGFILLALGLLRAGYLDIILSRPILAGLINAVGCTMMIEQLPALFGVTSHGAHGIASILDVFEHIRNANAATTIMGWCSVVLIISLRLLKKHAIKRGYARAALLPDLLFVVVLVTIITYSLRLDEKYNVKIIGQLAKGLPSVRAPKLTSIDKITSNVAESMVVAKVICGGASSSPAPPSSSRAAKLEDGAAAGGAKLIASTFSANRELVALGLTNVISSFFCAMPSFGSLSRSSVAVKAGARSQYFGLTISVIVAFVLFFAGPLFHYMPSCAAAAIVFVVGLFLLEFHDIKFLISVRAYKELFLSACALILTLVLGLQVGIAISLLLSLAFVLKHSSVPQISLLGRVGYTRQYVDLSLHPEAERVSNCLIFRIDEALLFFNIEQFKQIVTRCKLLGDAHVHPSAPRIEVAHREVRNVILELSDVPVIDAGALSVLKELVDADRVQGIRWVFVNPRPLLRRQLVLSGVISSTGGLDVFPTLHDAVLSCLTQIERSGIRSRPVNVISESSPHPSNDLNQSLAVVDDDEMQNGRGAATSWKDVLYQQQQQQQPKEKENDEDNDNHDSDL